MGLLLELGSIVRLANHGRLLSHDSGHLLFLLVEVVFVPTPLLDQLINDELYTPASLFMNFVDNGENFFLLGSVNKTFSSMVDGPDGYTCNTTSPVLVIDFDSRAFTITYRSLT